MIGKFALIGVRDDCATYDLIPFDTEDGIRIAAQLHANITGQTAFCYCVQDGVVGPRPFASYLPRKVAIYREHEEKEACGY